MCNKIVSFCHDMELAVAYRRRLDSTSNLNDLHFWNTIGQPAESGTTLRKNISYVPRFMARKISQSGLGVPHNPTQHGAQVFTVRRL